MRAAALACCIATLVACGGRKSQQYKKRANHVLGELSQLGVDIDRHKLSFEVGYASKARDDLDRQQDLFFRPGHFEGIWAMRTAFGLVATDNPTTLRQAAVAGVGQSLSAYYQYDRKALVFMQNQLSKLADPDAIVAHELTHAYQDQQPGGLAEYLHRPSLDQIKVAHAMIEGNAELVSSQVMLTRRGRTVDEVGEDTFDGSLNRMLVGEEMAAMYELGAKYLYRRYKAGEWKLTGALPVPPTSTEQLLHPAKLGTDVPTEVRLPRWDGGKRVASDVLGELMLYFFLLESSGDRPAMQAVAAGWDGDRFEVYRTDDDEWGLMFRTVWDRAEDADAFRDALPAGNLVTVRGHVVDMVAASTPAIRDALAALLASEPLPPDPPASDAASTAAVEQALLASRARAPYIEDGTWIHPDLGVRMPVPDGFEPREIRGTQLLVRGTPGAASNVTVAAMSNALGHTAAELESLTVKQFRDLGLDQVTTERTTIDGHDGFRFEYQGQLGMGAPSIHGLGVLGLVGNRQVIVTATVMTGEWPALESSIRDAIGRVAFR